MPSIPWLSPGGWTKGSPAEKDKVGEPWMLCEFSFQISAFLLLIVLVKSLKANAYIRHQGSW